MLVLFISCALHIPYVSEIYQTLMYFSTELVGYVYQSISACHQPPAYTDHAL